MVVPRFTTREPVISRPPPLLPGSAHEMRRDENSVIFKCENQNDGWSYRGSALPTICSLYSGSLHDKTNEMTCARITDWDHSLHFIYLIYLLTPFFRG